MADLAVSAALVLVEEVLSYLNKELHLQEHVHKEVANVRLWLGGMQAYLKDMEGKENSESEKHKVRQVRLITYEIEDVLDDVMLHGISQCHRHKISRAAHNLKHRLPLGKISSTIQGIDANIKSIIALNLLQPSTSSSTNPISEEGPSSGLRTGHQVINVFDDEKLVGFETPMKELINQLIDGESRRMTISLVGPGGSGKTILVKKVFESTRVQGWFDCHAWVHVSRSFSVEELCCNMLKQFCSSREEPINPREGTDTWGKLSYYLQQKRYLVVLDDIWRREDWERITNALPGGTCGSRIIVTTRNSNIASSCVEFSHCIHTLAALTWPKDWELFCKNAFRAMNGKCPPELKKCARKIVKRCEGLPLAIVAIGALLSKKRPSPSEWEKLHDSLGSEIVTSANLSIISKILLPSYMDLPSDLRSCFLYFSIFPEDYSIKRGRLIRMWVAERFVLKAKGKTPEEVAEDNFNELIGRNLVHVSTWDFDGRVKRCRVQNLVLEFIVQKAGKENFMFVLDEPNTSPSEKVRRLSIRNDCTTLPQAGDNFSTVRSVFFSKCDKLCSPEILDILREFKKLKVLDLQGAPLNEFPEYIVHLALLRYLSLRNTKIKTIPKSIKKLSYLETLDLKKTDVTELPKQILRLHNLRHLLVYRYSVKTYVNFDSVKGAKLFAGIGALTNLQKLSLVKLDKECNVVKELGMLTQLRKLGLTELKSEDGLDLCNSIQKMKYLTTFDVCSTSKEVCLNLEDMHNRLCHLQRLYLKGRLQRIPQWISSLHSLFRIYLKWSRLDVSPLEALKDLPNLMELEMVDAYTGGELEFNTGRFRKLKILHIERFDQLHTALIEEGALPELQKLTLCTCLNLKILPCGINYLTRVKELRLYDMHEEFITRIKKSHEDREFVSHIPVIHSFTLTDNQYWSLQNLS